MPILLVCATDLGEPVLQDLLLVLIEVKVREELLMVVNKPINLGVIHRVNIIVNLLYLPPLLLHLPLLIVVDYWYYTSSQAQKEDKKVKKDIDTSEYKPKGYQTVNIDALGAENCLK